jgi:purine-cytosine permease-like protein
MDTSSRAAVEVGEPRGLDDAASDAREDYALTPVPADARLAWPSILNVTIGIAGAMIFLQVSGQMALTYGTVNALAASAYATLATGALAVCFAYFAATTGLNSNLMARGAGYGFVGAALTSLIYASNFIVLAAIEGSIIAQAIHAYVPAAPVWLLMVLITIANIALNWYGMKQLDQFQKYSLPIYLVLLVAAIVLASRMAPAAAASGWLTFLPAGARVGGAGLLTCIGILNGIVGVQSLLTADYARFIRRNELGIGTLMVGLVPQLASYFIMGLVGCWFALRFRESNPGIYMVAVMGIWGALYTVLSQTRINVINVYSGSLSLANFFARIFGFAPGRVFWVVGAAVLALVTMLLNVLDVVGPVLTFQGVFMFAWAASMLADLVVVKTWLRIGTTTIEYRQDRLPAWNPVGSIALVAGSLVGGYLALAGRTPAVVATSAFVAGAISFTLHVALALMTRGRFDRVDA